MKFVHLIQINDAGNPAIPPLSVDQLWRGLVLRAEQPNLFMDHLDRFELIEPTLQSATRILYFGDLAIRDTVTYLPRLQVRYLVSAQGEMPGSSLTMRIEQPQPGALFVRFTYADEEQGTSAAIACAEDGISDAFVEGFRKSAYEEMDIDTIRIIRELAAKGELGV